MTKLNLHPFKLDHATSLFLYPENRKYLVFSRFQVAWKKISGIYVLNMWTINDILAKIYLFKATIETLEKGKKHVQS